MSMDAKVAVDYVEKLMNEKTKGLEEKIDSLKGEMHHEFNDVRTLIREHQTEIDLFRTFRTRFMTYIGIFVAGGAIVMTFIATIFQEMVKKYFR